MSTWDDIEVHEADISDLEADKTAKQAEITQLTADIVNIDSQIATKADLRDAAILATETEVDTKKNMYGL